MQMSGYLESLTLLKVKFQFEPERVFFFFFSSLMSQENPFKLLLHIRDPSIYWCFKEPGNGSSQQCR